MFLRKLLPTTGPYCVAIPKQTSGFDHTFWENLDQAEAYMEACDKAEKTVFVAQASFDAAKIEAAQENNANLPYGLSKAEWKEAALKKRAQVNTVSLRNFFLDLDCGPKKDYPNQVEAAKALTAFTTKTGLPKPAVVSSGNGLYAHWIIREDINSTSWKATAQILKALTVTCEFKTDPVRTSDSASVLRPPGMTHRKDPLNPKPVRLVRDMDPCSYSEFTAQLHKAAKKFKVDATAVEPPKQVTEANADFFAGLNENTSSITIASNKCAQLRSFKETKGNVSEPLWYSVLGVMVHCVDGWDYIQDWSSGHPEYTFDATQEKAQQYIDSGTGPTTCFRFGEINPDGCSGCPFLNKVKSPIILGWPEPVEITKAADALVEGGEEPLESLTPKGFSRAKDGLYFDDEGRWVRFYDQDLHVERVAYDETLNYQVAVIRHSLPFDGDLEFPIRSSLVQDPKALLTYFADNNVHVVGTREKKLMVAYVESYIAGLQRKRKMTRLLSQMGWREDGKDLMFVLGKKVFYSSGEIADASLARNVPTAATGYRTAGTLEAWTDATEVFNKKGLEPFAFALLCGFAAPLMRFTGFEGAIISMEGESGVGKTLLLRMVQSIYGFHRDLMMLRDDTKNSLVSRLGTYGNLPLTVDEITNIDNMELSDLVYRVTQGRDKARLNRNAEERKNLNTWNTLALMSTNSSLIDKLSGLKHDAGPEINRVFEYKVSKSAEFQNSVTSDLFWVVNQNYGHAGERYVNWLVQHADEIPKGLSGVQEKIDTQAGIRGEERFWSAIVATALYGGVIAKKLGLIKIDLAPVMAWAVKEVKSMRTEKDDLAGDSVGILGQFLDEHAHHRLLVKGDATGGKVVTVLEHPRLGLVVRYETDKMKLYISRSAFRTWLAKKYGSYSKVRNELQAIKALTNANKNKGLGAGTSYAGASQPCWEIDLKCQQLGIVGLQIVKATNELEGLMEAAK